MATQRIRGGKKTFEGRFRTDLEMCADKMACNRGSLCCSLVAAGIGHPARERRPRIKVAAEFSQSRPVASLMGGGRTLGSGLEAADCRMLIEIRGDSPAWSYRRRGSPCVEPTDGAWPAWGCSLLPLMTDTCGSDRDAPVRGGSDRGHRTGRRFPYRSPQDYLYRVGRLLYVVLCGNKLTGYELRGLTQEPGC